MFLHLCGLLLTINIVVASQSVDNLEIDMAPYVSEYSDIPEAEGFIPVHTEHKPQVVSRRRRAVTALPERLWPNAIIPYVIGENITEFVENNIYKAMSHWEQHTCIRFVNRTNEHDFIVFNPGQCGCCSYVGRKGGGFQQVTLTSHCAVYGVVIHELGHVVGFWHEHSRPDRDEYIRIIHNSILDEKFDNFDKKSPFEIDSLGQPYDYDSIMHYRRKTFSSNNLNTIEPLKKGVKIGQRDRLSAGDILQARLLYNCPKPLCQEEFVSSKGTFTTPNYPMNYYKDHTCIWIIHVFHREEIVLSFTDFHVEKSTNCTFDYLEIRLGTSEMGRQYGRLCGDGHPGTITSRQTLWIKFNSDMSITDKGFSAYYYKYLLDPVEEEFWSSGDAEDTGSGSTSLPVPEYNAKCNSYTTNMRGELKSPLVPILFTKTPIDCSWTIDGGMNASAIYLEIHTENMPISALRTAECIGDVYQKVFQATRHYHLQEPPPYHYSRDQAHAQNHKQWTTSIVEHDDNHNSDDYHVDRYARVRYNCRENAEIALTTSVVMVQWYAGTHAEFSMNYIIDYDECRLPSTRCEHNCINTKTGYYCSCHAGYSLQENGWQCEPKRLQIADACGANMTTVRGRIRAGTEPMTNCLWTISLPRHTRITLWFTRFFLPNPRYSTSPHTPEYNGTARIQMLSDLLQNCNTSYLEILVGRSMTSKGRFCGSNLPPDVSTPSGTMVLKLHTELQSVYAIPYFSAKYTAHKERPGSDRCFIRVRANGNITSPMYPQSYLPDMLCTWRISTRSNYRIHIKFTVFDIESTDNCEFDYLEIYDGKHKMSDNLIGRYCGKSPPIKIVSTGRHLLVQFMSDGDGSGQGFKAMLDSARVEGYHKARTSKMPKNVTFTTTSPMKMIDNEAS